MNKNSLLFLLFFVLFGNIAFAGGPWAKSKKSTYFQLGYSIILPNNKLFSRGNDFLLLPYEMSDQTASAYIEYGVTDKFTFITYLPYKFIKTQGDYVENNSFERLLNINRDKFEKGNKQGLGNVQLAVKYQLYKKGSWVASSSINISVPSSTRNAISHLQTGFDSWAIQPDFSMGYGNSKFYSYIKVAYNLRPSITDELKIELEAGYQFYKSILGILVIDVLQSTHDLDPIDTHFYYLYSDQQEYIASTFKLAIPINKVLGINLHMTIKTVGGNYVQKGPAMGGSIYWKL